MYWSGKDKDKFFADHYSTSLSSGHALGFFHEQSRTDRDRFVRILWQNIIPSEWRKYKENSVPSSTLSLFSLDLFWSSQTVCSDPLFHNWKSIKDMTVNVYGYVQKCFLWGSQNENVSFEVRKMKCCRNIMWKLRHHSMLIKAFSILFEPEN